MSFWAGCPKPRRLFLQNTVCFAGTLLASPCATSCLSNIRAVETPTVASRPGGHTRLGTTKAIGEQSCVKGVHGSGIGVSPMSSAQRAPAGRAERVRHQRDADATSRPISPRLASHSQGDIGMPSGPITRMSPSSGINAERANSDRPPCFRKKSAQYSCTTLNRV